jgi:glycosyltransferase involved in cell wall biosynthesis
LQGYKILVYPARLHPIKNHLLLIIALSKLIRKNKQILLILAGEGPTKNFIERVSIKLQVESNVILAGRLPYDETIRIMSLADLIPFPSLYEACPITIIEALWLSKKVLALDLFGFRELRHRNLVIAKSVKEYIEYLEFMLCSNTYPEETPTENDELRKFSLTYMVQNYLQLYNKALSDDL